MATEKKYQTFAVKVAAAAKAQDLSQTQGCKSMRRNATVSATLVHGKLSSPPVAHAVVIEGAGHLSRGVNIRG